MFNRISNAFKVASNDKHYLIMTAILFALLLSTYVINHPIIFALCTMMIVLMLAMIIRFYIKNEEPKQ